MHAEAPLHGAGPQPTTCPNGTLVASIGEARRLCPSLCRRWACQRCGRRNARKLCGRIMRTRVQRFLTLTIRADPTADPVLQVDTVNHAWRLLWKRIRRRHGARARGYVKVVEFTAAGTPHLHLALDIPFTSQRWLSEQWHELTGSPIVDIRAVHSRRGVARYLAKYLTKALQTVATRRKYSAAAKWLPPAPTAPLEHGELPPTWRWHPSALDALAHGMEASGYREADGWYYPSEAHDRAFGIAPPASQ